MRKFPLKPAAFAALLLLGLPIGPAAAQMKYDDFVRYGDYFPEANYPMTALEKTLFEQLQDYIGRGGPLYSGGPVLTKASLISVQISKRQSLLINLRKEFEPPGEAFDEDEFYFRFEQMAKELAAKLLNRESNGSIGIGGPGPISIYWVFEGKTAFPHQYEPFDPALQPKIRAPLKKSDLMRLESKSFSVR